MTPKYVYPCLKKFPNTLMNRFVIAPSFYLRPRDKVDNRLTLFSF